MPWLEPGLPRRMGVFGTAAAGVPPSLLSSERCGVAALRVEEVAVVAPDRWLAVEPDSSSEERTMMSASALGGWRRGALCARKRWLSPAESSAPPHNERLAAGSRASTGCGANRTFFTEEEALVLPLVPSAAPPDVRVAPAVGEAATIGGPPSALLHWRCIRKCGVLFEWCLCAGQRRCEHLFTARQTAELKWAAAYHALGRSVRAANLVQRAHMIRMPEYAAMHVQHHALNVHSGAVRASGGQPTCHAEPCRLVAAVKLRCRAAARSLQMAQHWQIEPLMPLHPRRQGTAAW